MEITVEYLTENKIKVHTLDGDFIFDIPEVSEFEVNDRLDIVKLIKNIWNNAKIKDSSLFVEIVHSSATDN